MANPSEADIRQLAEHMAELGGDSTSVFQMSWWNERLLSWALTRRQFKSQLFRLVDVFPAAKSNRDVLNHVDEYLNVSHAPLLLRYAIEIAKKAPFGARITAWQARKNISRMADQFIIGADAPNAVSGIEALRASGRTFTVDLLGEKTVSESEADQYALRVSETQQFLAEVATRWTALDNESLAGESLPIVSISIKPSALTSHYSPLSSARGLDAAKARIRPLLREAIELNSLVWFDMESYEVKDLTIHMFMDLLSEPEFANAQAGIAMQAYLKDTFQDIANLIHWAAKRSKPVHVRLVKGAYWDTETINAQSRGWPVPVFENKSQSDANYERCAQTLLDHVEYVHPAFASHNLRSLAYVISYARTNRIPTNAFEIQMLYGMAEPIHAAVARLGLRLRVYAPVGDLVPGMAYLVRRLLENTSNDSFVRMRFADNHELKALLRKPETDHLPEPQGLTRRSGSDAGQPNNYEPEPLMPWHHLKNRKAMNTAVKGQLSGHDSFRVPAIISGKELYGKEVLESRNPASPQRIEAVATCCNRDDANRAVEVASACFAQWSKTTPQRRARILFDAASWFRKNKVEIAAVEVVEAGKPWAEADADVCEAIDFCEYYGREMLRVAGGGVVQSPPGERNALNYQARGVTVVIAPWNFPLAIPVGMVAAAIVTGNTVILKPAEQTTGTAFEIVRAFEDAGLPRGVLQFLPGVGEVVGAELVAHRDVATVAFTGSKDVGVSISSQCASPLEQQRNVKRVICELGGKNPMIIDSDADLDQAIPAIVYSAFGFAGQKCSALSRLIVVESVKDELVQRLCAAVNDLQIGNPAEMGTELGPVIDADAHARLRTLQDTANLQGNVLLSRTDVPDNGYFVGPVIVDDVDAASPFSRNEHFGPLLTVYKATDIDHAIQIANGSVFALTAGLFSRRPSVIRKVSSEIKAGNFYINRSTTGATVGRQPFGGHGMSGGGTKAGGPDYLLQFMNPRVTTENTVRQGFAEFE